MKHGPIQTLLDAITRSPYGSISKSALTAKTGRYDYDAREAAIAELIADGRITEEYRERPAGRAARYFRAVSLPDPLPPGPETEKILDELDESLDSPKEKK